MENGAYVPLACTPSAHGFEIGAESCQQESEGAYNTWSGVVGKSLERHRFLVETEVTRLSLLAQEDTDGDGNITIDDSGPKSFLLRSVEHEEVNISGTYHLANLLQELTLGQLRGQELTSILGTTIQENPVDRLVRRINGTFWANLTRTLDGSNVLAAAYDDKDRADVTLRIYVPSARRDQHEYYTKVAADMQSPKLQVVELPRHRSDPEIVREIHASPGLLALETRRSVQDTPSLRLDLAGLKYVVPGGRFNEMYYWDSHFVALGLLEAGKVDIVCDIINNMRFEIEHYGAVLNGNRSYYLGRSQPPFLTDLVIRTFEIMSSSCHPEAVQFLRNGIVSAIKEYNQVWTAAPRLDPVCGLSRYQPTGQGIPPEVEEGHFDWFLKEQATKMDLSLAELYREYNSGRLQSRTLDDFFLHDRAMRESGHDTTARFQGRAGHLATIDLNSLLYKYERDIAWAIRTHFDDCLSLPPGVFQGLDVFTSHGSAQWENKAATRKWLVTKHLWNEETGLFHDYNTVTKRQTEFQSATTFWSLWSGLATEHQAARLVNEALPRFEAFGGIVATPPSNSRSPENGIEPPTGQWDHPFGWAPHQILLWDGLRRYGYHEIAKRTAYSWLHLLTSIAVDYNGMLTERYDVTRSRPTKGDADVGYGCQGRDFKGVNEEGFGWTNASYVYGMSVIGDGLHHWLRQGVQYCEIPPQR